jgi:hypothetical protein
VSTTDPADGMNDKQRAAFDKYVAQCARDFDHLKDAMQLGCVNLYATLGNMERTRQVQKDVVDYSDLDLIRLQEVSMVTEWIQRWQTNSVMMLASFVNASAAYDMILGQESKEPVEYNIMLELAYSLLPELKPCARLFQGLAQRATSKDTVEALADIGVLIEQVTSPKTPDTLNFIDKKVGTITSLARGAAKRGGDDVLTKAAAKLKTGYHAKNEIFNRLIGQTVKGLINATNTIVDLNQAILQKNPFQPNRPNLAMADLLLRIGGQNDPGPLLTSPQYDLLADQILYQMLRAYMQEYGQMNQWGIDDLVKTPTGQQWAFVPTSTFSDRLDNKAFDEILARFNSKRWKGDKNYPPVDSVEDMVVKWSLKAEHLYNEPPLTNAI